MISIMPTLYYIIIDYLRLEISTSIMEIYIGNIIISANTKIILRQLGLWIINAFFCNFIPLK